MATIVVEDGSALANSNSYVSEADLSTYATDRGVTLTGTASELLIQAMDYIEQQPFQGYKLTNAQALQWPRSGVSLYGYSVTTDSIPTLLVDAQCEACIAIDGGNSPIANVERETKSETVGDVSVTYMDGAGSTTYLKAVANKLNKLLVNGGKAGFVIRV